jgi:hypothetical protein
VESAVNAISRIIDAEGVKSSRDGRLKAKVAELMDGIQRAIDYYSERQ